jgi:hypothetical protein
MSRAAIEVEAGGCQNGRMVIVWGKVVDGRVEVDSELPEGASVTVLAREGDPETERILREAIARCERGETVPIAQLLGELRYRA